MNFQASTLFPTKPLKHVVSLRRTRIEGESEHRPYVGLEDIVSWTGRLAQNYTASSDSKVTSTANTFETGDVLFGKLRPYLAKAWLAEFSGQSSTECLVMVPVDIEPRFLRYACLSNSFISNVDSLSFGSKMPRAEWRLIRNLFIPVPERKEQETIADYLDRQARKSAEIAAKTTHVRKLLIERRQALISRAVLHGLDSLASDQRFHEVEHSRNAAADREKSNVLSSSFPTKRLKYVAALRQAQARVNSSDVSYVGLEDISSRLGTLTDNFSVGVGKPINSTSNKFQRSDVLFGKLRPYLAKVWKADFAGHTSTECLVIRPKWIESRFLKYICLCQQFIDIVNASTFGSKMPRAEWAYIRNIHVPVPEWKQQCNIADYLDVETAKIDNLFRSNGRLLELVAERQTALVACAVSQGVDRCPPAGGCFHTTNGAAIERQFRQISTEIGNGRAIQRFHCFPYTACNWTSVGK